MEEWMFEMYGQGPQSYGAGGGVVVLAPQEGPTLTGEALPAVVPGPPMEVPVTSWAAGSGTLPTGVEYGKVTDFGFGGGSFVDYGAMPSADHEPFEEYDPNFFERARDKASGLAVAINPLVGYDEQGFPEWDIGWGDEGGMLNPDIPGVIGEVGGVVSDAVGGAVGAAKSGVEWALDQSMMPMMMMMMVMKQR